MLAQESVKRNFSSLICFNFNIIIAMVVSSLLGLCRESPIWHRHQYPPFVFYAVVAVFFQMSRDFALKIFKFRNRLKFPKREENIRKEEKEPFGIVHWIAL
jgi:hypothetical protein